MEGALQNPSLALLIVQGAKLEVESVIRETCDRILADPNVPKAKLELRAVALGLMGDVSCLVPGSLLT